MFYRKKTRRKKKISSEKKKEKKIIYIIIVQTGTTLLGQKYAFTSLAIIRLSSYKDRSWRGEDSSSEY